MQVVITDARGAIVAIACSSDPEHRAYFVPNDQEIRYRQDETGTVYLCDALDEIARETIERERNE